MTATVTTAIIEALKEDQAYLNSIQFGEIAIKAIIHDGKVTATEITPSKRKRAD